MSKCAHTLRYDFTQSSTDSTVDVTIYKSIRDVSNEIWHLKKKRKKKGLKSNKEMRLIVKKTRKK